MDTIATETAAPAAAASFSAAAELAARLNEQLGRVIIGQDHAEPCAGHPAADRRDVRVGAVLARPLIQINPR
jgi:hypothetical protein